MRASVCWDCSVSWFAGLVLCMRESGARTGRKRSWRTRERRTTLELKVAEGSDAGAKRAAGGTHTGVNAAKWARRSGSGATAGATVEGATRKGGLAPKKRMQGVRGGEHMPAPAPKNPMQGVRGGEPLPAPARKEHMQGVRGGEQSASTSAEEANARSAGGRASASTSAKGADARSAGGRASASTSVKGADARSAGGRASGQHQRERSRCKECGGASGARARAAAEAPQGCAHGVGIAGARRRGRRHLFRHTCAIAEVGEPKSQLCTAAAAAPLLVAVWCCKACQRRNGDGVLPLGRGVRHDGGRQRCMHRRLAHLSIADPGTVQHTPPSPYTYSSSTHRFPDERAPIEATPLSATSAELGLGWGLGWGLDSAK